MSGHISRYNPQSRSFVKHGADGKFAPNVLSGTRRPQQAGPTVAGQNEGPRTVLSQKG